MDEISALRKNRKYYVYIAKTFEIRFDTSNYELKKNKIVIGLMKDELEGNMM